MASLATIPVEVVLDIVAYLIDEDLRLPIVGQNAVFAVPPDSQVIWKPATPRAPQQEPSDGNGEETSETAMVPRKRSHCSLKALRRTNRFFDEICQPFLYRELNLMLDLKLKRWKKITQHFIIPKWSHIQSISVHMDTTDSSASVRFVNQAKNVACILEQCRNLQSLALYYRWADVQMMLVKDAILSLLKDGRLSSLGFYSHNRPEDSSDQSINCVTSLVELIDTIALDDAAQRRLRVLDLFTESIPAYSFDLIRSRLKSLTSLTLRAVLRPPWFVSSVWDVDQRSKWHPLPHLTRLQLCHFEPGHAAHIPNLVRHFTSLNELTISACGNDSNFVNVFRTPGWSRQPDALCNIRNPLKVFHVEHMDDWEIYELGVIPTTTLVVTSVKRHHFLGSLRQDAEIFPGMQVLRLTPPEPPKNEDEAIDEAVKPQSQNDDEGEQLLVRICQARNVELRRDARANWTCVCTSHEGY